jgi:D-sedoheptulose 7-phosphate isomerase
MGELPPHPVAAVLTEARARRRAAGFAFLNEVDALARACRSMADRFGRGGRLLVWGSGLSEADARHVVVEFVHPVIVGKRALPAHAVDDAAQVGVIARRDDIVMTITNDVAGGHAAAALGAGSSAGALTVALLGGADGNHTLGANAEHVVRATGPNPRVARELQVTAYHILWELVHVFLEGSARVGAEEATSCPACADEAVTASVVDLLPGDMARVVTSTGSQEISVALVDVEVGDRVLVHAAEAIGIASDEPDTGDGGDSTREAAGLAALYPFLYGSGPGAAALDDHVRGSTEVKIREIAALRDQLLTDEAGPLAACASTLAGAFHAGGTLFTFGNGGSSTDARALARLFVTAADTGDRGLRAVSLPDDAATVTALANDVSFDVVYTRQLAALATTRDIAFGISTSGSSENVNRALRDAHSWGLKTVGLAGDDGGNMKDVESDHFFVVRSSSVHRVQEAQTTLYHVLWEATHAALH